MKFTELYIQLKCVELFKIKHGYVTKTTIFSQPYVAGNQNFHD